MLLLSNVLRWCLCSVLPVLRAAAAALDYASVLAAAFASVCAALAFAFAAAFA